MCSQDDAHFAPRVKGGANTTLRDCATLAVLPISRPTQMTRHYLIEMEVKG